MQRAWLVTGAPASSLKSNKMVKMEFVMQLNLDADNQIKKINFFIGKGPKAGTCVPYARGCTPIQYPNID
jgi:hypothetical protein